MVIFIVSFSPKGRPFLMFEFGGSCEVRVRNLAVPERNLNCRNLNADWCSWFIFLP
ncbi:hypothetical protein DsansV1_C29g0210041 [Dioscorea sansibarensis]